MSKSENEDLVLIQNIKNGDGDSLKKLISKYKTYTHSLIYKFTNSNTDNRFFDDCYQDVWVKVVTKLNSFTKGCFQSWLFILTRNVCITLYRKEKIKMTTDYDGNIHISNIKDQPYDYYKDFILTEIYENMDKFLTDTQYKVVSYRLADKTYREISELINIPYGTCLPAYTQAIMKMRNYLISKELIDPDDFTSNKKGRSLFAKPKVKKELYG